MVVTNPGPQSGTLTNGYTYVVMWFGYKVDYNSGAEITYSKLTWLLQETVTPISCGTDKATTGGLSDKYQTDAYSDATYSTTTQPARKNGGTSVVLVSPGNDWRRYDTRQLMHRYSSVKALGFTVTSHLWYSCHNPIGTYGAPWAFDDYWTYHEQLVLSLSSKGPFDYTVDVADATTLVTVPAGSFNCYVVTFTRNDAKTVVEYWDASGVFPYAPIKIIDNKLNFDAIEVRELHAGNVYP